MWGILLFVIFPSFVFASACHAECRYVADDPRFPPICETVCDALACEFNQTCGYSPSCRIQCPLDMCELDSCPQCETICAPPPSEACGEILCEATSCSWKCRKPKAHERPPLLYEVECEEPACAYSAAGGIFVGWVFLWMILILV